MQDMCMVAAELGLQDEAPWLLVTATVSLRSAGVVAFSTSALPSSFCFTRRAILMIARVKMSATTGTETDAKNASRYLKEPAY